MLLNVIRNVKKINPTNTCQTNQCDLSLMLPFLECRLSPYTALWVNERINNQNNM